MLWMEVPGSILVGAVLDGRPHSTTPLTVTAGSRQPPNPKPKLSSNNILLLLLLLQSPRRRLTAILYREPSRGGSCLIVLPFFVSAPCHVFGCVKSPRFPASQLGVPLPSSPPATPIAPPIPRNVCREVIDPSRCLSVPRGNHPRVGQDTARQSAQHSATYLTFAKEDNGPDAGEFDSASTWSRWQISRRIRFLLRGENRSGVVCV